MLLGQQLITRFRPENQLGLPGEAFQRFDGRLFDHVGVVGAVDHQQRAGADPADVIGWAGEPRSAVT